MKIFEKTARMTVNTEGSVPSVSISRDGKAAVLHLERNHASLLGAARDIPDSRTTSAINIKGSVDAIFDQSDWTYMENIDFHFIQVARDTRWRNTYVGSKAQDGAIVHDLAAPPLLPAARVDRFLLDSGEAKDDDGTLTNCMPFTNPRRFAAWKKDNKDLQNITIDMDDHPNSRTPLRFPNSLARSTNYLFEASHQFEAVTAFVFRSRERKVQILAYISWNIIWLARFKWNRGVCTGSMVAKAFTVADMQLSSTNDPEIDGIVKNPPQGLEETYNSVTNTAVQELSRYATPYWSIGERADREGLQVPADFWTA
ncbi:hypothetical protein ACMDCR_27545 [Labrys okinawensis]|uniref:hypothetical protein n=1 Tax=Labrys okinawensis TaxID=346911 RepID=UPI0039BD4165